jgi:tetratricopeptide (TPR) repeat protein
MKITKIVGRVFVKEIHKPAKLFLPVLAAIALALIPRHADAYAVMVGGAPQQSDYGAADYTGADAGFVVLSIDLHDSGVGMGDIILDAEGNGGKTLAAFTLATGTFAPQSSDYKQDGIEGSIVVRALPPGDYALTRFLGTAGSNCGHGAMAAGYTIPFTVKPGQTTYLGNFRYEPLTWSNWFGAICSAGGYFVVGDQQARDIAKAKTKQAKLPDAAMAQIPDPQALDLPLFRSTPVAQSQPSPTSLDTQNSFNSAYGEIHSDPAKARSAIDAALKSGDLWQTEIGLGHSWLGAMDIESGDLEGAVRELSEAVRLNPLQATAWGDLAIARFDLGDFQNAEGNVKTALQLSPENIVWLLKKGDIEAALHNSDLAMINYDDAVTALPKDPQPYFHRGVGNLVLGQFDAAIADFDQANKLADSPVAIFTALRCVAGVRAGHGDPAMADCDNAVKLAPKNVSVLNARGFAHLLRNEPQLARPDFDAALAIAPGMSPALFGRAMAEQKSGDSAASKADFDTAHQSDKTIDNLVMAYYGIGSAK